MAGLYIEYQLLERHETPLGELALRSYCSEEGSGYEIILNGVFLMATHGCHSERAMASLAAEMHQGRDDRWDILVGGLGMGYTLNAALNLPKTSSVTVVEALPQVVHWNRTLFAEHNSNVLSDKRVRVVTDDLRFFLQRCDRQFHLLLFDIDNGPGWLASPENEALYSCEGLALARKVMKPLGVLAVWSPSKNPIFLSTLREVFSAVHEISTESTAKEAGEPPDIIYIAME